MTPGAIRPEDLSAARRWAIFGAIMTPYLFYAFCWNSENFLRPYMAESIGLSKEQVAAFYSAQALGALIGSVVLSQIADRYGRRRTFIGLIVGFGSAALGVEFVQGYASALLQRLIMGFFLGGVFGCTVSLYVTYFQPGVRGRLSGLVQLVYNGGDAMLSWFGRLYGVANWRELIMIGGGGAVLAALIVAAVVPADGRVRAWESESPRPSSGQASIRELFSKGCWRVTLRLALLCGLNFFAFQAFNGWTTTFLRETHSFSPDMVGRIMTALHVGSMLGALFWGAVADRFGRRANAWGFALSAVFILAYLRVPPTPMALGAAGFAYGFCLVSSGVWGPYFTELYPDHLRTMAASIFGWGRVVSLFGALFAGAIAQRFGLEAIMTLGAATFALAAFLWWSLPETLNRSRSH